MSLKTDVEARVNSQTLIEWTRPRDNAATTVDETYLTNVCNDVEAVIEVEHGYGYQADALAQRDKDWHRVMGIQGVMILLEWYANISSDEIERKYQRWIAALARRRKKVVVDPDTDAKAQVTDPDGAETSEDRMPFDRANQKDWLAGKKGSSLPGVG